MCSRPGITSKGLTLAEPQISECKTHLDEKVENGTNEIKFSEKVETFLEKERMLTVGFLVMVSKTQFLGYLTLFQTITTFDGPE